MGGRRDGQATEGVRRRRKGSDCDSRPVKQHRYKFNARNDQLNARQRGERWGVVVIRPESSWSGQPG
jgi:hypothetical protein